MSEAAYPELLDTDLTSFHIEGFFTDDGTPFRVPLISHVVGNLWQGGCVDGVRLPDDFEFVVGLTNSQHYVLGPDTVRVEVAMDDSPIVPDRKSLFDLARVTSAFCAKGKTLVHCQAGFNRSGLIAGLALVLDGMAPVDAIALMRAQRSPLVLCNPVFENWLLSYGQAG